MTNISLTEYFYLPLTFRAVLHTSLCPCKHRTMWWCALYMCHTYEVKPLQYELKLSSGQWPDGFISSFPLYDPCLFMCWCMCIGRRWNEITFGCVCERLVWCSVLCTFRIPGRVCSTFLVCVGALSLSPLEEAAPSDLISQVSHIFG